jgi:small subunit ribosomal protein S15
MALTKDEKQSLITKYAQDKGDTGSPEVQVAILTKQIEKLQGHLAENKHDSPAKRGLLSKIAKRRRLLRYLTEHTPDRYAKLIKELGLKK